MFTILHGNGPNQQFLRKSYLKNRRKALKDREGYTEEELDRRNLDLKQGEGGGATNPDTYKLRQQPLSSKGKRGKKIDIRDYNWIGG